MGRWDVALSYAGAQRDYVEQVAAALKARGLRCFYDADEKVPLWGKYLAEELPAIYGEEAAVVVVFLSAEYAARDWTVAERRAVFARAVRERREYVLPARFDDTPLPGLLQGMATVNLRTRTPQEFAAMIVEKLAELGIAKPGEPTSEARPAGAVRVSEADPRRLGVHAAISVPGIADEILPEYVPRDADAGQSGVRARVAAAADRGGFLLLVGGSSVGKTRCAVEAVKALLPDWWLVHPDRPAEVAALARAPLPRTLVWLDELQRYLDGGDGLTAGMIRSLLSGPHQPLIIATLWPDYYTAYTALPAPGSIDQYARERQVVDLATVVRIGPEFSPAERERTRAAAIKDWRLKIALDSAGNQLTQLLAAAPQLVARWEDARTANPYAWAVLTAALDAARLGARTPLSAAFLEKAAPGYCSSRQLAVAPHDWFERAMAYATGTVHGATAALTPVGTDIGHIAGYSVADYLIQQATLDRRSARVPASTWDAILDYIHDHVDIGHLAWSARDRLLNRYAIPLYRRAAEAGGGYAMPLARLLINRGDLDEAWRILDASTGTADQDDDALTDLMTYVRVLKELRAQADAGDESAAERLAEAMADRDDPDELTALADAGDIPGLRARADAGDSSAAIQLADVLVNRDDLDQLRARADAGDQYALSALTSALTHRGDLDQLGDRADAGDAHAAMKLAEMLTNRGDLAGLRDRADAGDGYATMKLDNVLVNRGDLAGLRDRADAGDGYAELKLADVLIDRGDFDQLHARADAEAAIAAMGLADTLTDPVDLEDLGARADAGDKTAATRLADVLINRGDLAGLRDRADAGDNTAAIRLAVVLTDRGDLDELRHRADAGDRHAGMRLADALSDRGDLDQLLDRASAGYAQAEIRLASVLAARGDLRQLRHLADHGYGYVAWDLVGMLAARGGPDDIAELRDRADAGDEYAELRLSGVLAARGDIAGLRARVEAGDGFAAMRLPGVMIARGQREEGELLRQFGLNPDGSIARA